MTFEFLVILWFFFDFLLWSCLLWHVRMHLWSSRPSFTHDQVLGSKFDFPGFLCPPFLIYEIHGALPLIFPIVDWNRFMAFLISYGWNWEDLDHQIKSWVDLWFWFFANFTVHHDGGQTIPDERSDYQAIGQTAHLERSDCSTHFDLNFRRFWLLCFAVWIGFNTRFPLYLCSDLHRLHSYWSKN